MRKKEKGSGSGGGGDEEIIRVRLRQFIQTTHKHTYTHTCKNGQTHSNAYVLRSTYALLVALLRGIGSQHPQVRSRHGLIILSEGGEERRKGEKR